MITLKEIASELHVSTTTVSNVIHGKTSEVSASTVERVRNYLEEVGYVPNMNARNLVQNRSRIIGLVLIEEYYRSVDLFTDPFVAEMVGSIERTVREAGYFMMLYISKDVEEIIKNINLWNVDGLVLFGVNLEAVRRIVAHYNKPLAFIDSYLGDEGERDQNMQYINIGLDDEAAAYQAVHYLIGKGHRRIAFFSRNMLGSDRYRFQGYLRAMHEAGFEASEKDILLRYPGDQAKRSYHELAGEALDYTAVFCCSDTSAVHLINAFEQMGVHVPEDMSVVGFDDNSICGLSRPALTTVSQNISKKGELAVEKLLEMIHGAKPKKHKIILETHLIERNSVCPPKQLPGSENPA